MSRLSHWIYFFQPSLSSEDLRLTLSPRVVLFGHLHKMFKHSLNQSIFLLPIRGQKFGHCLPAIHCCDYVALFSHKNTRFFVPRVSDHLNQCSQGRAATVSPSLSLTPAEVTLPPCLQPQPQLSLYYHASRNDPRGWNLINNILIIVKLPLNSRLHVHSKSIELTLNESDFFNSIFKL